MLINNDQERAHYIDFIIRMLHQLDNRKLSIVYHFILPMTAPKPTKSRKPQSKEEPR